MNQHRFDTIGIVRSCYPEKFGAPRQPGLVPEAEAEIEILPPYNQQDAFRGLEHFSHIWILFVFHHCDQNDWKPSVRPPRLGGNRKIGVFATRSGFRPNPIGQSVVKLDTIQFDKGTVRLRLKGVDLVDGTPVIDIKPYVAYCDRIANATCAYADAAPEASKRVVFTPSAREACQDLERCGYPTLTALIVHTLELDPRPGYKTDGDQRRYGLALWDLNIAFRANTDTIVVESITGTDERLCLSAKHRADPNDATTP